MVAMARISGILSRWQNPAPPCANAECPHRGFFQGFKSRHNGISLAQERFCCPECFETGLKGKITALSTTQGKATMRQGSRIPLGLLLLSRGILTTQQIRVVLERQQSTGENFGDAAQQLGFVTPEQVTAAVAKQWACPVFPLGERFPETKIRIPRRLLELYRMLPVHYAEQERRLLIGFVNSVHHHILYTIEHMTSCVVAPCFITGRDYERNLLSAPPPESRDDELLFDQTMDASEMARIARSYVVQVGAQKARLGRCRDYLWARIWGRQREFDLLFRVQTSQS